MVGGGDSFYVKFWFNCPPWIEIADFQPIFACSASAVTPNEKSSINTNRKFTTRFPMSLRWSSYVASKPAKGAQKPETDDFRLKSHFAWRKSATKFLCVKTVSSKVVRPNDWPNYSCKNYWWGQSILAEILDQTDRVGAKSPIFDLFSLVVVVTQCNT